MQRNTVRLTMAQALVRYLCNQHTIIDGERVPLFAGVFAIFGHGNVTCLSEALEPVQDRLPTWRGQNEQSMALAAIGYTKAKRRRQIMIATSSIGPGALNMVTAAGTAHANRLPILILAGDTFTNRLSDPVLQQVEHFGDPTVTVNDAFKAVSRYWDRITHPAQIIASMPQAIATMLDPGDCGPAFIALPQDTQELAFDYPLRRSSRRRSGAIPRPRADRDRVAEAAALLRSAKKPLIISGGGVRYSGAEEAVADVCFRARDSRGRDDRRQGRAHPLRSRPLRPHRGGRLDLGQCARRRRRRDPRHRHPPAGLHHRVVDGVRARRDVHLDQRRALGCDEAPGACGGGRRPRNGPRNSTPPSAPGRPTLPT